MARELVLLVPLGLLVVFVQLENTKIELMTPLGANSPVAKFLENNPSGGIHHAEGEVRSAAGDELEAEGGDGAGDVVLEPAADVLDVDADGLGVWGVIELR